LEGKAAENILTADRRKKKNGGKKKKGEMAKFIPGNFMRKIKGKRRWELPGHKQELD